ncbi:MAG TPA: DEAD/DEAH box helicase family protein [Candidatus Absconditabacterales bacterium]|nr:DEAD/DEAH box helicase family protein [Candidatus Absconditabacterales bacterium]
MENGVYKDFLTIIYEYYNFGVGQVIEKKIKFYSEEGKGKDKKEYMPPTIQDIYYQTQNVPLFKKDFQQALGTFELDEPSEEIKEKLKENLARQDEVMKTIKLRNEKFNYNCGLIKAGTGVGKSVLAIKITGYFGCNTLILVSNVKLLGELKNRFKEFIGWEVGVYGGGKKEIEAITICTKKSFSTDYEKIQNEGKFETIIIDECHEGFSESFRLAINKSFKNVNLFGMSATPFTPELEQKYLERYFGKVIDVMDGYDYKPDFEIIDYKPGKIKIKGEISNNYIFEDYAELRNLLAEDEIRFEEQMKILKDLYLKRNAIIVLTDRILESNNFYDRLAKGDTSKFNLIKITGETNTIDDEEKVKEALNNGKKTIIIGSIKKIGTGFDFPPADTVFLVSAIKWKSTTEQAIGRILRKHNKLNPLVIIWNDESLRGQKLEKLKTIKKVYGVDKNEIKFIELGDHREAAEKFKLDFTSII